VAILAVVTFMVLMRTDVPVQVIGIGFLGWMTGLKLPHMLTMGS
jgi:hypothetical protein